MDFDGRVIITWPAAPSELLPTSAISIVDADSGEPLPGALELHMNAGIDTFVHCQLVEFCNESGEPLRGTPLTPVPTDEYRAHCERGRRSLGNQGTLTPAQAVELDRMDAEFTGERYRTVRHRYLVAEMRVGEPAPAGSGDG